MFFIEEQTRGTILFSGKVENPLHLETIASRGGSSGEKVPEKGEETNKVTPVLDENVAESNSHIPQTKVTFTGRGFHLSTT